MDSKIENKKSSIEHSPKVLAIVKALVAGAHSLFITPIKRGNKLTNRLPLLSEVNSEATGRYFVLAELSRHYKASMAEVVEAIKSIHGQMLAYVDTSCLQLDNTDQMIDILELALLRRGDGGFATQSIDSSAKLYIRDLKCKKPSTGKSKRAIVAPDWITVAELQQV